MLKKSIAVIALGIFTTSTITACGSNDATLPDLSTAADQTSTQVETSSYKGIYKEIGSSAKYAFKEYDKNNDKFITPDEYGITTADAEKAFRALDSNKDGKISENEFTPGFFSKVGLTLRLKSAADGLFKQLDKSKDGLVSKAELTSSSLVSSAFVDQFDKYDKEKKTLLHKDAKGMLSKSEFEDLFAHIALSGIVTTPTPAPAPSEAPAPAPSAPAPAPVDPAPSAPAPAPATK